MSSYLTKNLRRALLAKGFQEELTHHRVFRLVVGDRKTEIRTYLSHGVREYGDSLLAEVARQMHLRRSELDAFVHCPMSHEAYARLLRERGARERAPQATRESWCAVKAAWMSVDHR